MARSGGALVRPVAEGSGQRRRAGFPADLLSAAFPPSGSRTSGRARRVACRQLATPGLATPNLVSRAGSPAEPVCDDGRDRSAEVRAVGRCRGRVLVGGTARGPATG